ncbi:MAG: nitroreductase family protein [Ruminiclostridium sp.]|nr:nitroreductase family protein [Ruminiclostridium sp.]
MNAQNAMLKRTSVRTYKKEQISQELKQKIAGYINTIEVPFNTQIRFKILDLNTLDSNVKLGTYGVIQGATTFLCAVAKKENRMEESLGYVFEKIVLYITSLGLGTCWLGGSFNKADFEKAIILEDDEFIPVISPIGYAEKKKSLLDKVMAAAAGSKNRKEWAELFFEKDFSRPLEKEKAGIFEECFDMIRIAPSASNKQPWRIIKDGNNYHFFVCRSPGYGKFMRFDIQRLDVGIAMCHFELTLSELGGSGNWSDMNPNVACGKNIEYVISYTAIA